MDVNTIRHNVSENRKLFRNMSERGVAGDITINQGNLQRPRKTIKDGLFTYCQHGHTQDQWLKTGTYNGAD